MVVSQKASFATKKISLKCLTKLNFLCAKNKQVTIILNYAFIKSSALICMLDSMKMNKPGVEIILSEIRGCSGA